jgi:hypothetical protein
MILELFPELQRLDRAKKVQLVSELVEELTDEHFSPELVAALEELVAFNEAHPELESSVAKLDASICAARAEIAVRRTHG